MRIGALTRLAPLVLLASLLFASSTNALILSFATAPGATVGGQPVSARADFSTVAGALTIGLVDLQSNPTNLVQTVTDLEFTLSDGRTTGTLLSSSGTLRTINADKTFTNGATGPTNWVLESFGSGLRLRFGGPTQSLIGDPNPGDLFHYTAADATLTNVSNNPFLTGTATFTLSNFTSDIFPTSVTFSFDGLSSVPGQCILSCIPGRRVPEPSSLLLLGAGLVGLAGLPWRRWRRAK